MGLGFLGVGFRVRVQASGPGVRVWDWEDLCSKSLNSRAQCPAQCLKSLTPT